ncbi:hypothetical protein HAX54_010227, partial [Datura stramonium]|nr:hypothetical protein [Datura stramonium]
GQITDTDTDTYYSYRSPPDSDIVIVRGHSPSDHHRRTLSHFFSFCTPFSGEATSTRPLFNQISLRHGSILEKLTSPLLSLVLKPPPAAVATKSETTVKLILFLHFFHSAVPPAVVVAARKLPNHHTPNQIHPKKPKLDQNINHNHLP